MCTAESLLAGLNITHNSYPQRSPWEPSISSARRPTIHKVVEENDTDFTSSSLDQDQIISATLRSQERSTPVLSASPAPVYGSSQPPTVSASPAAMFLSCFSAPTPVVAPKQDEEGQVVSAYTLGPIIGYGATSVIRQASSSSGDTAAVKIVRRADLVKAGNAPQARKRLQHEAAIWATLSHEHILPLFNVFHSPYADYFFTLLCPAGSLFDILKRDGSPALPQDDAGMMFRQVVRGLRYLHEVALYVHRDMKLENVLVDEMGVCKIGDFGMARHIGLDEEEEELALDHIESNLDRLTSGAPVHRAVSLGVASARKFGKFTNQLPSLLHRHNTTRHRNSTSAVQPVYSFQPGSLPYAAPEMLLPQTADAMRPHPAQDIWALGVMLYALLTGHLPFSDSFEPRTYEVPEGIGRGAERLLQGCLESSVADRWTIAMVDEVAWGVGWGAEGDMATPGDEPDVQFGSRTHSRSRSRPPALIIPNNEPDWQSEENRSRSAVDAASRRSSSRVKRSLSRAPLFSSRSPSVSRRRSRAPSPSSANHFSATPPIISPVDSSDGTTFLLSQQPSAFERGRRPSRVHHSTSRSPSPSIAPTTPVDMAHVLRHPEMSLEPEGLILDPIRGRPSVRSVSAEATYLPENEAEADERMSAWSSRSIRERLEEAKRDGQFGKI